MARRSSISIEEQARNEISEEIQRVIDQLTASEGPAADAEHLSSDEVLNQWGQRDPRIGDAEGLKEQLMTTGLGQMPQMMDPNGPDCLAIFKEHPELAEMYAEPTDEPLADMLSRLAEFPLRLGILAPYEDDPEQMVKVADDLDRRWQRKYGVAATSDAEPVVAAQQTAPSVPMQAPALSAPMMMGG